MIAALPDPIGWAKGKAGDVLGGAVNNVAGGAIDKFAEAVSHAVGESVKAVATIWTKVPTVGLGSGETATKLQENLYWYMGFAAVLSVLIAGGRMAWEARAEPARELGKSLITLVVVSGASLALIRLAVESGDAFAAWIIGGSTDDSFDKKMTGMLVAVTTVGGPLGSIIVIVVGLILVLASMAQIILMIARSGMLVLLAGILPLSASATNTEWGKQWFQKTTGWMIAFILYKPAAALVYASAFELFGESKDLVGALTGMTMMILAVAALPALMKLCVPLVGGLAGGGGGAAAGMGAGMLAMQAMPSGAVDEPSQTSTASAGTPGGGPSGSTLAGGGGGGGMESAGVSAGGSEAATTAAGGAASGGVLLAAQTGKELMDQTSEAAKGAAETDDGGPNGSQQ